MQSRFIPLMIIIFVTIVICQWLFWSWSLLIEGLGLDPFFLASSTLTYMNQRSLDRFQLKTTLSTDLHNLELPKFSTPLPNQSKVMTLSQICIISSYLHNKSSIFFMAGFQHGRSLCVFLDLATIRSRCMLD